jgi:predicted transcriptional regulator
MTQKELLLSFLEKYGTKSTMELVKLTGINKTVAHNSLRSMMRSGLVNVQKRGMEVYWTAKDDIDLDIKQIWGNFVPTKAKHTHPLMTAWF